MLGEEQRLVPALLGEPRHVRGRDGVVGREDRYAGVHAAKPAAEIFRHALDRLGVTADAAVFVDDQAGYCAGGAAVGITAVQIVRGELDGQVPAAGTRVVRSLPEVEVLFPG